MKEKIKRILNEIWVKNPRHPDPSVDVLIQIERNTRTLAELTAIIAEILVERGEKGGFW